MRILPLLLLVPTLAAAATVRVRVTELGASEPCRSDRALANQLRTISGVTVVTREFDFEAALEREAADWRISLRKPDGTVALQRSLVGAKECADVSFAAALIIERFARALDVKLALPTPKLRSAEEKPKDTRAQIPVHPESSRGGESKAGESKAAATKAAEVKAAESKAAESKAAESKAAETKAAETKAAAVKAAEVKAAEVKAAESKAAESKAAESKAAAVKAAEVKAAEVKAAEVKAAEVKAAEVKAAEVKAAEVKAAEVKAAEVKAAEVKAAEAKAAEVKAAEVKAAEVKAAEARLAEASTAPRIINATAQTPPAEVIAAPAPTTSSTVRLSRWEISAGAAGWAATSASSIRPSFHADAAIFLSDHWRIAAQFALAAPETVIVGDSMIMNGVFIPNRGTFTTQPNLALLGVSYCRTEISSLRLRPCAGIAGGTHAESGTTAPNPDVQQLFRAETKWLVRPAFGLELQLAWRPLRYLSATLGFTGLVLPTQAGETGKATFQVEGLDTRSLPLFEGLLRLSLALGADR